MIPAVDNIFIMRGDDWERSYLLFQGRPIVISGASGNTLSAATDEFPVLMDAVPSGRKLWCNERILTLTAAIQQGQTSISVSAIPWPIQSGETAYILADLTSVTGRARISGNDFTITPTVAIGNDPLIGEVILSLTDTQTATIPANIDAAELQSLTASALQKRQRKFTDYDWDFDLTFPNGVTITPYRGLCVVGEDIAG